MKRKTILILILAVILVLASLSACSNEVGIDSVTVKGNYKTEYVIGEEFNSAGMQLVVTYADGTTETINVADVKPYVIILDFDTESAGICRTIHLKYKNCAAQFDINVYSAEDYESRFTVSYDTMGGSEIEPTMAVANGTLVAPEDPTLEGYAFDGWYKEVTHTNLWNFNTDKVIDNVILYAKWSKLYKITFNVHGSLYVVKRVKDGGELTDIPKVPTEVGKEGTWDRLSYTNIRQDITVNAVYTDLLYSVGFYDYDESDAEIELEVFDKLSYGTNVAEKYAGRISSLESALKNNPNKANYHFVGWEQEYNFVTSNIKVYAQYERDTHDVTFVYAEGGLTITTYSTATVYHDAVVAEPAKPVREGYEFDGWFRDAGYETAWNFNSGHIDNDRTIYAKWTRLWKLDFKYEDGTIFKTIYVRNNEDVSAPAVPDKLGYNGVWDRTVFTHITADDVIIPKYTIKVFRIRFVDDDQTPILVNDEEYQEVEYGSAATLPANNPIKAGHTFKSWSSDYTNIISSTDIVAQYEVNSYTVMFDTGVVGINEASRSVIYSSKLSSLTKLSRTNYDFDGWFKDEECTEAWNVNTDVVLDNITLYAKWTELYVITFTYSTKEVEFGTIEVKVRRGELITEVPDVPADEGKNGVWEFSDGSSIDFTTYPVYSNNAFKATYTISQYYVTFHFDDGNSDFITPVEHGSKVSSVPTDPANPEKVGYQFVSWDKDPAQVIITGPTVFYPVYTINKYDVTFAIKAEDSDTGNEIQLKSMSVDYGSTAIAPEQKPEKAGYTFAGWDKSFATVTESMVIYATFQIRSFTVSFRDDGNNVFADVENVKYNSIVVYDKATPELVGWVFLGWDYDGDGVYNATKDNPAVNPVTDNMVILAKFAQSRVSIQFNVGTGVAIDAKIITYGSKLDEITPTNLNEDMAFFGWYMEEEFANRYDFSQKITEGFTLYAKWEEKIEGSKGIEYEYDAGTSTYRVKSIPQNATDITIANCHSDKDGVFAFVTAIGSGAMKNRTSLVSVYLPTSITSIGAGAFAGCSALRTVAQLNRELVGGKALLPDSILSVGDSAFANCTALTGIYFSETDSLLNKIGDSAFSGCYNLEGFTFPCHYDKGTGALTQIEINARAFAGCSKIKVIEFPVSIYYIGSEAFKGTSALRYVEFASTTPPTMESTAFIGSSESFHIYVNSTSASVVSYTNDMASGWQTYKDRIISINSVTYDNNWSYTIISSGALTGKVKLMQYIGNEENVVINNTIRIDAENTLDVGEVADYAFDYVPREISFDTSLTVNNNTFSEAVNLQHLSIKTVEALNTSSAVILNTYNALPGLNKLSISASKTLIDFFGGNSVPTNLTTINIINDATYPTILDSMFEGCSSIISITLPAQIKTIGAYAFKGCTSLREVSTSKSSVASIGKEAFAGCTALDVSGLDLPKTLNEIGDDAFKGTPFLAAKKAESDFIILGNNLLYMYVGHDAVVKIPAGVKSINSKAFYNNSSIHTVAFTNETTNGVLQKIGTYAFANCIFLENVIMPSALNSIGDYAFSGDSKLVKFIEIEISSMGAVVPTVGVSAFGGTKSDMVVYLPNKQTYELFTDDNNTAWTSIFGDRIYSTSLIYESNRVLEKVNDSTVSLIQYFGAQTSVVVDEFVYLEKTGTKMSMWKIYNYAFPRGLEELTISAKLKYDDYAFAAVTNLTKLTITNSKNVEPSNRAVLHKLLRDNEKLTTLEVSGDNSLYNLFGGAPTDTALTSVNILAGSKAIVAEMFKNCTNITNITFPGTLEMGQIGAYAFENCGWLNNSPEEFVTVPTTTGDIIVAYKGNDNVVKFPTNSDINGIAPSLLKNNNDIEIIYIGSNITHIYASAFAGASSLTKVFMYGTTAPITTGGTSTGAFNSLATGVELYVPAIGAYTADAFNSFSKKTDVSVEYGGYIYEPIGNGNARILQCLSEEEVACIPATINGLTVTAVGNDVFFKRVKDISFYGDDELSSLAFANLSLVEKITVDNTSPAAFKTANGSIIRALFVKNGNLATINYTGEITMKALLGNSDIPSRLSTVGILSGATHLVDNMLASAATVAEINLPSTITSVGANVFEDTAWYSRVKSDYVILFNSILYKYKGSKATPNIPGEVQRVNAYAFSTYSSTSGWSGNQIVTGIRFALDSQCTHIAENAFYGCSNLVTVDLPDSIVYVDPNAFIGTKITSSNDMLIVSGTSTGSVIVKYTGSASSVTIPYDVVGITQNAFAGRTALTTVSFASGSNLQYIRDGAFSGCTSLRYFGIGGDNAVLPTKLAEIGAGAFANTPWYNAANDFVTVGDRLVLYTGSATAVTINGDIKGIASGAFKSVSGITSITFTSETPILASNMGSGALDGISVIYVPAEKLGAYKGAWPAYQDKMQGIN